jgi:endoglucanase
MTAPRTITTTNRGGSLQSVQFRLNDINIRANHTYNFAIAGSIGTAAHATATAVLRNGGASGDTAIGTSPIGAGGAFSITMSRTAAQVTADLAQGEHAVYSLGNTSGLTPGNPNIIVNTMSVIETCPPACTTCVVRTITLNAGGGTGVPATLLTNQYTGRLETLPEPTRSGFKFMGWFTAATGGDSVDISRIYTANTTIFARWMSLADKVIPADLTAAVVVAGMGVGWNLGNTLDSRRHDRFNESSTSGFWAGDFESASATPNVSTLEQLWNVPVTTATLITGVKNAGFDTIRIPVTWHKATDPANNWTIRADWMARVKQLVDFAYNIDMYVIINTHHDEYILPLRQNSCPSSSSNGRPVTVGGTRRYGNRATAETVLPRLWTQICATFNNEYGYKLIFEGINEPRDPRDMNNWTATDDRPEVADRGHGAYLLNSVNRLNQIFVNTVRASSGNNANRILMTPTYAANADSRALNGYRVPTDSSAHRITVSATNVGNNNNGAVIALNNNSVVAGTGDTSNNVSSRKIALSIHRYEPHTFTLGSSTAVWTEAGIRSALQTPRTRATALGIPVVLGEWGVTNNDQIPAAVREAGRAHYANCYVRVATEFGMRTILWDNGNAATRVGEESHGHLNRANGTPHFPAIVTAIRQGRLGQRSCTCTAGNCRNLPAHS